MANESEAFPPCLPCLSPTACGTTHSSLRCMIYSKLFSSFNPDYLCTPLRQSLAPLSLRFLRVRAAWTLVQPGSVPSIPIRCLHALLPMFCPFLSQPVSCPRLLGALLTIFAVIFLVSCYLNASWCPRCARVFMISPLHISYFNYFNSALY